MLGGFIYDICLVDLVEILDLHRPKMQKRECSEFNIRWRNFYII